MSDQAVSTDGWWNLSNVAGTREGVLKAIAASKAPPRWQAALKAEIESLDAKFNFVKLDAHFHTHHGHSSLQMTIVPSTVAV